MTDKGRLELIISKHSDLDQDLSMDDKTWLIHQAEKVEMLEEAISGLDGDYQFYKIECDKLEKKVEQLEKELISSKELQQSETKSANEYFSKMDKYERALKRIISKNWVVDIHKIAENALEETK